MSQHAALPLRTIIAPIAGWLLLGLATAGIYHPIVLAIALIATVLAAVHHAEVVAHRVGEPFGTLVLAIAVTLIEVALIVSMMLSGGEATMALARDTVFAAVMIILTGMTGICLLVGGGRHGEQQFGLYGVTAALGTLAAIVTLTLVLPNYTSSFPGPIYTPSQLIFIAVVTLILYGTFVMVQTIRHRDYFLPADAHDDPDAHSTPPSNREALLAGALLLACLGAVVLLAKKLSPSLELALSEMGAPKALVGIVIAAIVLLPEGLAAVRAAHSNRLQTSLNLALGSALASIGLTIPTVAVLSLLNGWTLTLGIDVKSTVLLMLSLIIANLSLSTGRTTVMQGVIHLVLFAVYLFTTIVP